MVGDLFDQLMRPGTSAPAPSSSSEPGLLDVALVPRDERMAATNELSTTGTGLVRRDAIMPELYPTVTAQPPLEEAPPPPGFCSDNTGECTPAVGELSPLVLIALGLAAWWAFA